MIQIRKSDDRGKSQLDWLKSAHTFSFAEYHDPHFMGLSDLRVINEDIVRPGMGFSRHPHRNMEIISYVIDGQLEHKDSMGNGSIIQPGEIQIMSAGTGVEHSEFNHSKTESLHFLQIWIIPNKQNLSPSYQQIKFQHSPNQLLLIGSQNRSNSAVMIHQDINLYVCFMQDHHTLHYSFNQGRIGWLQLIKGSITLNKERMNEGDGAAINEQNLGITSFDQAEFLFFDLRSN